MHCLLSTYHAFQCNTPRGLTSAPSKATPGTEHNIPPADYLLPSLVCRVFRHIPTLRQVPTANLATALAASMSQRLAIVLLSDFTCLTATRHTAELGPLLWWGSRLWAWALLLAAVPLYLAREHAGAALPLLGARGLWRAAAALLASNALAMLALLALASRSHL